MKPQPEPPSPAPQLRGRAGGECCRREVPMLLCCGAVRDGCGERLNAEQIKCLLFLENKTILLTRTTNQHANAWQLPPAAIA